MTQRKTKDVWYRVVTENQTFTQTGASVNTLTTQSILKMVRSTGIIQRLLNMKLLKTKGDKAP